MAAVSCAGRAEGMRQQRSRKMRVLVTLTAAINGPRDLLGSPRPSSRPGRRRADPARVNPAEYRAEQPRPSTAKVPARAGADLPPTSDDEHRRQTLAKPDICQLLEQYPATPSRITLRAQASPWLSWYVATPVPDEHPDDFRRHQTARSLVTSRPAIGVIVSGRRVIMTSNLSDFGKWGRQRRRRRPGRSYVGAERRRSRPSPRSSSRSSRCAAALSFLTWRRRQVLLGRSKPWAVCLPLFLRS